MPQVPIEIASVVLTGRYIRPDGTPLTGTLTFEPPAHLTMSEADVISTGAATAELDSSGAFRITLIATDAPGVDPSDWTYRVTERLHQAVGRTYPVKLPAAAPVVDLADIAPTDPDRGDYVVVAGPPGERGPRGSMWYQSGSVTPDLDDVYAPVVGDMFLYPQSGDLFRYSGTAWEYAGSVKGPKGDKGDKGDPGSSLITSVNGKTGAVTLSAADVGAATPASVTSALSAHTGAPDPHGDRAYADGKFLPLAGGTMTGGLTSAQASATATAFAFGLASDTFDRARILANGKWELGPGTAARDTQWYRQGAAKWGTDSDVAILAAGKGLQVAEGANAKSGIATLVAGQVTVSTTAVTANSRIQLTVQTPGGTVGAPYVNTRTAGASFVIKSTSTTDTSVVAWFIVEPAA
ncbi:hypothetical protein [Streptomyces sp. NPDC086782]|uniref:hypothetical protein n=1 Tax=Streptomyces sp. NPDC086782 TaxID=3365757 RepID=UPI003819B135